MTYKLKFLPAALKEWERLAAPIKSQLKKKLVERLEYPRVPSSKLAGYDSVYKIKLRASGYRLVYEVLDHEIVVCVIAIAKREKGKVYVLLEQRSRH
jgi:mRNA interferase RelE/StbE